MMWPNISGDHVYFVFGQMVYRLDFPLKDLFFLTAFPFCLYWRIQLSQIARTKAQGTVIAERYVPPCRIFCPQLQKWQLSSEQSGFDGLVERHSTKDSEEPREGRERLLVFSKLPKGLQVALNACL